MSLLTLFQLNLQTRNAFGGVAGTWAEADAPQWWCSADEPQWWYAAQPGAVMSQQILTKRTATNAQYAVDLSAFLPDGATAASITSISVDQGSITFASESINAAQITLGDGTVCPPGTCALFWMSGGTIPYGLLTLPCTIIIEFVDSNTQTWSVPVLCTLSDSVLS